VAAVVTGCRGGSGSIRQLLEVANGDVE